MRYGPGLVLLLLLAALATGCANGGGPANGVEASGAAAEAPEAARAGGFGDIPRIVEEVEPAVVAVVRGGGEGSGVILDEDGLIVTNFHVVEGATSLEVVFATGERAEARVTASDPLTDLALLDVDREGLPAARLAEGLPEVGELAIAIGNPLGFENTVTAGIVSGLHRSIPSGGRTPALIELIQTDAPISPGNSGGALVNGNGDVMGINVAFIPPEARAVSIGFAIPAPTVRDVVEQLRERGEVRHAFLGVRPAELSPQLVERFGIEADAGVLVFSVVEGSGAARAGLMPGDVVVAMDGEEIRRVEDLLAHLRGREPGDEIDIDIIRDGDRRTVTVELGERSE